MTWLLCLFLPTNSMKQSPPWEAKRHPASHKIPHILCNLRMSTAVCTATHWSLMNLTILPSPALKLNDIWYWLEVLLVLYYTQWYHTLRILSTMKAEWHIQGFWYQQIKKNLLCIINTNLCCHFHFHKILCFHVRSDILTAAEIKVMVFCDTMLCSSVTMFGSNLLSPLFYQKDWSNRFLPVLVIYQITWCHVSEHHNLDNVSTFLCAVTIIH
jgi:hypothetical protein